MKTHTSESSEVPTGKTRGKYDRRFRIGVMIYIRDMWVQYGYHPKAMLRDEDMPSLSTVYRWMRELGIKDWVTGTVDWNELNQYLKPAYQQWTRSTAAHGAAPLYQN